MVPFVGPSYELRTKRNSPQRAINLMPTKIESGMGKAAMYLKPVPGLEIFTNADGSTGPAGGGGNGGGGGGGGSGGGTSALSVAAMLVNVNSFYPGVVNVPGEDVGYSTVTKRSFGFNQWSNAGPIYHDAHDCSEPGFYSEEVPKYGRVTHYNITDVWPGSVAAADFATFGITSAAMTGSVSGIVKTVNLSSSTIGVWPRLQIATPVVLEIEMFSAAGAMCMMGVWFPGAPTAEYSQFDSAPYVWQDGKNTHFADWYGYAGTTGTDHVAAWYKITANFDGLGNYLNSTFAWISKTEFDAP